MTNLKGEQMIVVTKNGAFSSRLTTISGPNGAYAISTAKEGFFKGLSTMIYECSLEPLIAKRGVAKVVYSKLVSKNDRLTLHDAIVEKLNLAIENSIDVSTAFDAFIPPLKEKGIVADFINVA
jgi:hypothetical protein